MGKRLLPVTPPGGLGDREPGSGRKRDLEFADILTEELRTQKDLRSAILAAGRRLGWSHQYPDKNGKPMYTPYKEKTILRRGRQILARAGVVEYLKSMYDAIGFSPLDGARMLVNHIEGNLTKDVATKEGDVVQVKIPPSLDALKLYFSQTTEEQTKKVQVDTRMLVAHKMVTDQPPPMRARVLKSADPELSGS